MNKINTAIFTLLAFLALGVIPASAQDTPPSIPVALDADSGSISITHELQTTAEVELVVGEQLYILNVPVTIQIDNSSMFEAATLKASTSQLVGKFAVEPLGMETIEGEYEKQFRTVTPGPEEVVVVYRVNVTNLHDETMDLGFTSNLDTLAIDEVGNMYEEENRLCDSLNPGATMECEFIFKVPATAKLVDLEIKAVDYERFAFPTQETVEE